MIWLIASLLCFLGCSEQTKTSYDNKANGIVGDPILKRIVIYGSNIPRSYLELSRRRYHGGYSLHGGDFYHLLEGDLKVWQQSKKQQDFLACNQNLQRN